MSWTSVYFKCKPCRFEAKDYEGVWLSHLLTEDHQRYVRSKIRKGSSSGGIDEDKSVLITGTPTSLQVDSVLEYFGPARLSLLTNFVHWTRVNVPGGLEVNNYVLSFMTKHMQMFILNKKHNVDGVALITENFAGTSTQKWKSIEPQVQMPLPICIKIKTEPMEVIEVDMNSVVSDHNCTKANTQDVPELQSQVGTENQEPRTSRKRHRSGNDVDDDVSWNKRSSNIPPSTTSSSATSCDNATANFKKANEMLNEFYNSHSFSINMNPNLAWKKVEEIVRVSFPKCVLLPLGLAGLDISSTLRPNELVMFADIKGHTRNVPEGGVLEIEIENQTNLSIFNMALVLQKRDSCIRDVIIGEKDVSFVLFRRIEDLSFSIQCRIHLTDFLTAHCNQLIRFMCKLDPRVRPLISLTSHWATHFDLTNLSGSEGRFSEFAMHLLVLMFLANKKILPCFEVLKNQAPTPMYYKGTNVAFFNDLNVVSKLSWKMEPSLLELDPVSGKPSSKCILGLMGQMLRYFTSELVTRVPKAIKQKLEQSSKSEVVFYVQHPLTSDINNVASQVSTFTVARFQKECDSTAKRLVDYLAKLLNNPSMENLEHPMKVLTPTPEVVVHDKVVTSKPSGSKPSSQQTQPPPSSVAIANIPLPPVVDESTSKKQNQNGRLNLIDNMQCSIVVSMNKVFTNHARDCGVSPANFQKIWLGLLEEFNNLIWPFIFGIIICEPSQSLDSLRSCWTFISDGSKYLGVLTIDKSFLSICEPAKIARRVRPGVRESILSQHIINNERENLKKLQELNPDGFSFSSQDLSNFPTRLTFDINFQQTCVFGRPNQLSTAIMLDNFWCGFDWDEFDLRERFKAIGDMYKFLWKQYSTDPIRVRAAHRFQCF